MLTRVSSRLTETLFQRDTEYAELLLGVLSVLTGIWLFFPYCHLGLCLPLQLRTLPEVCGSLLLFTGGTKLIGVFLGLCKLRKLSCMLATIAWFFIASSFSKASGSANSLCIIATPLSFVLGMFNGLIYTKLYLVEKQWKNS